jgi:hypothetical protein
MALSEMSGFDDVIAERWFGGAFICGWDDT